MTMVNVMLVDDHQLLVEGFEAALAKHNINVVKSLTTLNEVESNYEAIQPDVLILDIRFEGQTGNGLDTCEQVLKHHHDAKIIMLSQFDQDYIVQKAYEIGAKAFIRKDDNIKHLVEAIHNAVKDEVYFSPDIAQKLAKHSIGASNPLGVLSERQMEIFMLTANGLNQQEIAEQQSLSIRTVNKIIAEIKAALSLERQTDFTKLAIKHQLIEV